MSGSFLPNQVITPHREQAITLKKAPFVMTNFLLSLEQYADLKLSEHALVGAATKQRILGKKARRWVVEACHS